MKVLEIVLPVLVMILLGMACRKWKLLNQNGIDNMKVLVTQIMLPVAIFHALATADYNKETGILVGIMFVMLVISFSLGFAMRPLMPEQRYRKYLPFMVSVYEGGSMAYPLYTSLCGAENLSQIAVLDIAGLLFGFSVYMGMLGQVENGDKIDVKKLFASAIRTPAFIASVLGILAGLSGVVLKILEGPFAGTYTSVENILTTSVTSIILVVVGYSIELDRKAAFPVHPYDCASRDPAGGDDRGSAAGNPLHSGRPSASGPCGDQLHVFTSYLQHADFLKERGRKRLRFHHQLPVLSGVHSGVCGDGGCGLLIVRISEIVNWI